MTLVRLNNGKPASNLNNLMDDFLKGFPSINEEFFKVSRVPVNIRETNDAYLIDVIAPGMDKADFNVSIDRNILTISAEKKSVTETENEKQVLSEFRFNSFKRSFTVDEKIDSSNIQAKYENGILSLNLPKKPEVKESVKQISIL